MTKMVYVLDNSKNNRLWGVFSDPQLMYSMYQNLVAVADPRQQSLRVRLLGINTNTVYKEWLEEEDIYNAFHPESSRVSSDDASEVVPRELRLEFGKLKTRYSEFKSNLSIFRKMLDERVIAFDSPSENIPPPLQKGFDIYCDIVRFNVPEEDAFGYFIDRFYYHSPANDV